MVEPDPGVTMLNNIVDNIKQCEQQNIVQFFINHERVDNLSLSIALKMTQLPVQGAFIPGHWNNL